MDFTGKVAIVTGGADGIGKAISKALLDIGMKICICDISECSIKQFFEEIPESSKLNVISSKSDVSILDEFRAAFEQTKKHFGRLDVVINNAGIMNEFQWKKVIDINFIAVIHGIQLGFEFMGKNSGGSGGFIINTASIAGINPVDIYPVYSGCKCGVIGLTKSYGQPYHFEKTGITVNAICPGSIDTKLFHTFPSFVPDEKYAHEINARSNPISPSKVGKAVVQLLRDGKNGSLLRVENDDIEYVE